MNKVLKLVVFIGLAVLYACAQQVAPTGGIKDEQPPSIKSLEPKQEVLNYENQPIVIEFDEFIQLKNLKKNFLSSPPLEHDLETKIRGKRLEIKVLDTLQENTTYVFNFGNAIADFHEGNPIEGFTYVFSTGNEIDTLSLEGRLVEAFNLEVVNEAVVMLYDTNDLDSLPFKKLPKYVDRTDKEGKFALQNLKAGTYVLFALQDKNTNYLFDKPDELVAYFDTILNIQEENDSLKLYGFFEDREKQYVKSQKENGPLVAIEFNRTISDSLTFELLDTTASTVLKKVEKSKGGDSLLLWFNQMNKRELYLKIQEGEYTDTIKLKLDSLRNKSKLKVNESPSGSVDYFKPLSLEFNRPIKSIDSAYFDLRQADSSQIDFTLKQDSLFSQRVYIQADLKEDSSYMLVFYPQAFTDLYGKMPDTTSTQFSLNSRKLFSRLDVTVKLNDSLPKLLQLIGQGGKVLQEHKVVDSTVHFKHVRAGEYELKLLLDKNDNGKWDTGIFSERKQAERVYMYEEKLKVRANWDQEIEWVILP